MRARSMELLSKLVEGNLIEDDVAEVDTSDEVDPEVIDPVDDVTPAPVEEMVNDEEVAGTESLSLGQTKLEPATLNPFFLMNNQRQSVALFNTDKVGDTTYIWFNEESDINPRWVNQFCYLLDTATKDQKIHLHLGCDLSENHILNHVGAMVSAIIRTKAELTAIVNGSCGLFETILFVFAPRRIMRRFGQLTIQTGAVAKEFDTAYGPVIDTFFDRVAEIGLIELDDLESLIKDRDAIIITPEIFSEKHIDSTVE